MNIHIFFSIYRDSDFIIEIFNNNYQYNFNKEEFPNCFHAHFKNCSFENINFLGYLYLGSITYENCKYYNNNKKNKSNILNNKNFHYYC